MESKVEKWEGFLFASTVMSDRCFVFFKCTTTNPIENTGFVRMLFTAIDYFPTNSCGG